MRSNREYDYFGNVLEYEYDYFASYSSTSTPKVLVLEYEYEYEYKYKYKYTSTITPSLVLTWVDSSASWRVPNGLSQRNYELQCILLGLNAH